MFNLKSSLFRQISVGLIIGLGLCSISAVTQVNWYSQVTQKTIIDCRTYGCDPTGVSDSTSAIQTAIDAASVNGASATPTVIQLPSGTYLVSSPILLRRNGIILKGIAGEGLNGGPSYGYSPSTQFGGTIISASSTHPCPVFRIDPLDVYTNTSFLSTNVRGTAIQDITIDVSAATTANNCVQKTASVTGSGAGLAYVSGNNFTSDMQGETIQFNTHSYVVGSYNSSISVTLLTTPASTVTGTITWANPVIDIRSLSRPPTFSDIYIRGQQDMAIRVSESWIIPTVSASNPYPSEHIKFYNLHTLCCIASRPIGPGFVVEGSSQIYLDHSAILSGNNAILNSTRTSDTAGIEIRSMDFGFSGGNVGLTSTITEGYPVHIRVRGEDFSESAANGGSCTTPPISGGCSITPGHYAPNFVNIQGHFGENFNRSLVIGDENTGFVYPARQFSYDNFFDKSNSFFICYDGTSTPGPGDGSTTPCYRSQLDYTRGGQFDNILDQYWHYQVNGTHVFNGTFNMVYDPQIAGMTFIYLLNPTQVSSSSNYQVSARSVLFSQLPTATGGSSYDGMSMWCYDCSCSGRTPGSGGSGESVNWRAGTGWVCGN